ncbi:hypothetical protein AMS68_005584 [Peltaster fructicola]|uniref:Alpha/beta hydrolase fold-3 domain-containing protein n=1 Tax=Peltaster fructicola TaxID=286661 RepID=A0A6H0XZ89_9PEZI|nr:hypothetical protein AMS68_005584 [Peltaster fructicola]
MILDQIEWSDCAVFLLALIPQLLLHVPILELLQCAAIAVPFIGTSTECRAGLLLTQEVLVMPLQLIHERYLTPKKQQSLFIQQATVFQDVVIRCVRFAFANIQSSIGKVFFSKWVSLPFMRYRMLRNGILQSPVHYREVDTGRSKCIYIVEDDSRPPSILIYYSHGGGMTMGSPYFYMEFLMAWIALLKEAGHPNPAVLAIDYTLVPGATYPTQVQEMLDGYKHALSLVPDSSRIVVSGDSAGGTLVLSLLLTLTMTSDGRKSKPALAVLISPWTTLVSDNNRNTPSDYLDANTLKKYGQQYIGKLAQSGDARVSPGNCKDLALWKRAAPTEGMYFIYGQEEFFGPEIRDMISVLKKADILIDSYEESHWIHAWPVVKLFLCNEASDRLGGLRRMVKAIDDRMSAV